MKLHKLNQAGVTHYLVPAIVVLIVAVIGVKVLSASHADTVTLTTTTTTSGATVHNVNFFDYQAASATAGVQTVSSWVNMLGNEQVSQVSPGSQLVYSQALKGGGSGTACYYIEVLALKGGGTTATVKVASLSNTATRTLSVPSQPGAYQSVCIGPGTQALPAFSVQNLSPSTGPDILVYQEVFSY